MKLEFVKPNISERVLSLTVQLKGELGGLENKINFINKLLPPSDRRPCSGIGRL